MNTGTRRILNGNTGQQSRLDRAKEKNLAKKGKNRRRNRCLRSGQYTKNSLAEKKKQQIDEEIGRRGRKNFVHKRGRNIWGTKEKGGGGRRGAKRGNFLQELQRNTMEFCAPVP